MTLIMMILALVTLIITVYIEIKDIKEKGFDFLKAIIGIAIALTFLSYPLFDGYRIINRILASILYAIQSLVLNEDVSLVTEINEQGIIYYAYVVFIYLLYFIAPLLSVTALLSLFENTFSKLEMIISSKKEFHIFSEINEKTIALANSIVKSNNQAKIIFTNKSKNNDIPKINHKFLKIDDSINELNLSKIKKEKIYYFMSNDEEENLKESLILLNKIKLNEKNKVYILNETQEAYMMIDSLMAKLNSENAENKGNQLEVEIVNETERIVLQRLESLPIEKIFKTKEVNVLIVGCGKFGQVFLKAISWCFQVIGYTLKIIVIEKNEKEVINKLNLESTELLKKYPIEFIDETIENVIAQDLLNNININYVIVNVGTDTNNFNVAVALRRYFSGKGQDDVLIDLGIRDYHKSKNIATLKDEAGKNYNLNLYGTIEDAYNLNSIINSKIEKMAKKLNELNYSNKEQKKNYYLSEYNRKSSRAGAVHIKYKLYSILKESYTGNMSLDLKNYKKCIEDEKNIRILAENEHNRWLAYMYADGYKTATIEDVEKYYLKIGGNHKNTLARLHPVLVPINELPKVEKEVNELIGKLTGTKGTHDFVRQNDDIVKRLDEIVL